MSPQVCAQSLEYCRDESSHKSSQWPEARKRCHRTDGITNVELGANFVSAMNLLPLHLAGRKTTDIDPRSAAGILMPIVLKEAIMTLLAATRCLDHRTGSALFKGKRHHNIRCLEVVGILTPKRDSFLDRPWRMRRQHTVCLSHSFLVRIRENQSVKLVYVLTTLCRQTLTSTRGGCKLRRRCAESCAWRPNTGMKPPRGIVPSRPGPSGSRKRYNALLLSMVLPVFAQLMQQCSQLALQCALQLTNRSI